MAQDQGKDVGKDVAIGWQVPYKNQLGDTVLTIETIPEVQGQYLALMMDKFDDRRHDAVLSEEDAKKLVAEFEDFDAELMYKDDSVHTRYFKDFMP